MPIPFQYRVFTLATAVAAVLWVWPVLAVDIEGVNNASLDQPRVNGVLKLSPDGDPLVATVDYFGFVFETINVQAFYDTGASGVLISEQTADAFNLARSEYNGETVTFNDVGVGDHPAIFNVSDPLYIDIAPFGPYADIDNPATAATTYGQKFGPILSQIGPVSGAAAEGLDVFGMPTMAGKTVVMDPLPLNSLAGTMNTFVYDSMDPAAVFDPDARESDPGIPDTSLHIDLSYANFDQFTETNPTGATGPTMRHNPFVGPNPLLALDGVVDDKRGVAVTYDGLQSSGSWLFDTGAAASILSEHKAAELGVSYSSEVMDDGSPILDGVPLEDQFTLTIGGIGGSKKVAGFFLDTLVLPTREAEVYADERFDLKYIQAPVLVLDITVMDPISLQTLTLDGVLGMNYLVATMFVSETQGQSWGDTAIGAYEWLTFDEPSGVLGLELINLFELPQACHIADANCDGQVGLIDLDVLGQHYGQTVDGGRADADFNEDGIVGLLDLDILGLYYAQTVSIPEPCTGGVVLLAGLLITLRRHRQNMSV